MVLELAKRIVPCLYAFAVLLLLFGSTYSPFSDRSRFPEDVIYVDDDATSALLDQQSIYEEMFDPDSVVEVSVDISYDQLRKLQTDYEYYRARNTRSPIYRIADSVTFAINGKKYVVYDVGIRLKGTSSRCNFFNELLGIYNLVNFKLCFNCAFDDPEDYRGEARVWEEEGLQKRRNRTFATMSSIEAKWNIPADNTYVRNLYVQDIFRDYGIPAQKCALSSFRVGNQNLGIYRLFEPVDESFIRRYFPEEDWGGDLYKVRCTQTCPATYLLNNNYGVCKKKKGIEYNFDLKTNIGESRMDSIRNLLETVNDPYASKEDFDAVADMDEIALVQAINFAVGNQDDMRNNYNNHYVYFRKSDGKAVIIPYDNEIVLGDTYLWSMYESGMANESPYVDFNPWFNAPQENPILRRIVLEGGDYADVYTAYLREIADSKWLTEENYIPYFNLAKKKYADKLPFKYRHFSTMTINTAFSMDGGESCNGNLAVGDFMEKKKAAIYRFTE